MPESEQEALISALGAASMGAEFIWEPLTYRKGSGVREPADLAWFFRGTIILMNMKAANAPAQKLHEQNLKQFRGWLRAWASGQHLRGSNDWQYFDLTLAQVEQIVLVSIAEGGGEPTCDVTLSLPIVGVQHEEPLLVARLTPAVLMDLTKAAGSACDLADLCLYLASLDAPPNEAHVQEHVRHMFEAGRARAGLKCDPVRDAELDRDILRTVLRMGRLAEHGTPPDESIAVELAARHRANPERFAIFNEWDFETTLTFLNATADLVRAVWIANENGEWWHPFQGDFYYVEPYHFVVTALNLQAREETIESSNEWTKATIDYMQSAHPDEPIILMSALVEPPPSRHLQGMMSQFGPMGPRTTAETFQAASELVRARDLPGDG